MNAELPAITQRKLSPLPYAALIIVALGAFCAAFFVIDNAYFQFADARFPHVGAFTGLAALWGVVSRAHLLVLLIPLVLWRPRLFGFQVGRSLQYWRMVLIMLLANCGVIGAYLWLTASGTPFSGNQWLLTEVITVPFIEETFWRGLVFTVLMLAFQKRFPAAASQHWAVWLGGLAFGALHLKNAMTGAPLAFATIQALSAMIWGVLYGYARAKTESIYPAILLHAAMNLVVVLF